VDLTAPLLWFADQARGWQQRRRRVRVLVHRGIFLPAPPEYNFMKVVNLSPSREIEITHVWFDTNPPVHIDNRARPLPVRLRLDETFETWVPVAAVPDAPNVERLGGVLLSAARSSSRDATRRSRRWAPWPGQGPGSSWPAGRKRPLPASAALWGSGHAGHHHPVVIAPDMTGGPLRRRWTAAAVSAVVCLRSPAAVAAGVRGLRGVRKARPVWAGSDAGVRPR
jgi:hypothetical protein